MNLRKNLDTTAARDAVQNNVSGRFLKVEM